MASTVIQGPPGFFSQFTRSQAGGRWWNGNLMRWRQGQPEKLPGWQRLVPEPFLAFVRRMHSWVDLQNRKNLLVGTDWGLQIVVDDAVFPLDITYYLSNPQAQTWCLDNLGEDGLAVLTGGPLEVYHPSGPSVPPVEIVATAPVINTGMIVGMPQAQVIMWGTQPVLGEFVIDPLLLRFSDAGSYADWTATVSNQAGSYRLSSGSRIVAVVKAPQTILVFTDVDVWSMSYIGPPLVYGFTIMGTGCGLVSPHAVVTLGRTTYWQGRHGIWSFGDGGVQQVPSTVHDYIFDDLDEEDIWKCHAGANSIGNEVWFFFPSLNDPFRSETILGPGPDPFSPSDTVVLSNESTRYIKFNTVEKVWDSGKLARTAWINNNVYGLPLGADLNYRIQQHEIGFDDDDQPMRGVFIETGFSDISEGDVIMLVDQCQPDFKWFGKNGGVNLTFTTRPYPGGKQFSYGPYSMTETTQFFNPRVRSKLISIRYDWVARKGFSARVGGTVMRVKRAGRRP